jgi:hypothetical protein
MTSSPHARHSDARHEVITDREGLASHWLWFAWSIAGWSRNTRPHCACGQSRHFLRP